MPGIYQQIQTTCDKCGGKGNIVSSHCPACKGAKIKRGSHQITVTIEKGMKDGTKIEFEGESDQSPDYQAGDVIFTLKQVPHGIFTRQGDLNLVMKHAITLKQALLGFETSFKHMDGQEIPLVRKEVTQDGCLLPNLRVCSKDCEARNAKAFVS